ncbi:MAG: radical SAM family heme chaperone HemW, partial [Planctomycetales bacterium]|nr:radical SAM family heme chaperone HemW [Planctomycetales bacterium]
PAKQLERLFALIAQWLPLSADAEVSVEVNPLDLTDERAEVLARAGVNRISLGVQSFQDRKLEALDRDHRAIEIEAAVQRANRIAASVGLDLIFAAPEETLAEWRADLAAALATPVQHVSTYGLTLERGTAFGTRQQRGELVPVVEDLQRDMYVAAIEALTEAGFEHYEVSNFARPGHRCRHNENYWLGGSYFAFGPGAARHLAGVRETNHRSTTTYIRRVLAGQSPVAEREELGSEDRARELLVFAMRRLEGIDRNAFRQASGWDVDDLAAGAVAKFERLGLLASHGNRIALTREGLLVSDALWPEFLAP